MRKIWDRIRGSAGAAAVTAAAAAAVLMLSACGGGAKESTAASQQAQSSQESTAGQGAGTGQEAGTGQAAGSGQGTAASQGTEAKEPGTGESGGRDSAGGESAPVKPEETAAPEGELLETDYFTVVIPSELEDLYDVSVTPASAAVYEKNAHETGGGFVFSISAYGNPADYANNPHYDRCGMVTDLGNQNYDLVIEYPSDVQMDLMHREEYAKLSQAIPDIADSLQPAKNYRYTAQEDIDTTGIYTGVLDELYRLMKAKTGAGAMAEHQAFSTLFGAMAEEEKNPLEKAAYCFMDITGDGYDELLLGCTDGDEIYDLYAPVDGKPVHIFQGDERACWYLTDQSQTILYRGSGGADFSVNTIFDLPSQDSAMCSQISLIYDGQTDRESPWFIDYGGDMKPEPVTEEAWNEMEARFGEIRKIPWTPLKEWRK